MGISSTKRVYLCSRVAEDARQLNNTVAAKLRDAGFTVYVPHEQSFNNGERYDARTIFLTDYEALRKSAAVVAVGRMGADCSWELGYSWATEKPVIHVPGDDKSWENSPMLGSTLRQYREATVEDVAERVKVATHEEIY